MSAEEVKLPSLTLSKLIEQLKNDIDILNNTSIENENEINYFRKEAISQLNKRFDELIHISNAKINQKKKPILSQINELQSLHDTHINNHIMNNKHTISTSVSINFQKKEIFNFIHNVGNVNDIKIKYKVIPSISAQSMHESRYNNEYDVIAPVTSNQYAVIGDNNHSFTDYITFDDFDILLTEFDVANNNKLETLKKLDACYRNSSRCQTILHSKLIKGLHQMLESNNVDLQCKSMKSLLTKILSDINTMKPNDVCQIFDKNLISMIVNIIDTNPDTWLTIDALQIFMALMGKFKREILENNILDGVLALCGSPKTSVYTIIAVTKLIGQVCAGNDDIKPIYITKILQMFCILVQNKINVQEIERCLISVYDCLNKMNDNMQLFNGDIVIDGYSFVQNNNKHYFASVVCGFIRRDTNEYIIPNDIAYKCSRFMDYGAFPVKQLLQLQHHSFLTKLLSKGIDSTNSERQLIIVQLIRRIASVDGPDQSIQMIIDEGIIPKLLRFLENDKNIDCKLQVEVVWTFVNVCSGTDEQTQYIIDLGTVPLLVNLLNSKSISVQEQTIWAIGNIAGTDVTSRNIVLRHDAISLLLPLLHTNIQSKLQLDLLRNAAWTLSNFCRGKPSPDWVYIELAIKALKIMIKSDDDEIIQDVCWAFSYLADIHTGDNNAQLQLDAIMNSGCVNKLMQFLNHPIAYVRHPSLRTIGNIITLGDEQTEYVIKLGLLEKMQCLMCDEYTPIKRDACWTISNITGGTKEQIEFVISANLISSLIHVLKTEKLEVSKEALWAISNLTRGGTDVQITFLVNKGVIEPLSQFINPMNPLVMKSNKCLLIALIAVENILAVGLRIADGDNTNNIYLNYFKDANGVDYLKQIQAKQTIPDEIHAKASSIIKSYFDVP